MIKSTAKTVRTKVAVPILLPPPVMKAEGRPQACLCVVWQGTQPPDFEDGQKIHRLVGPNVKKDQGKYAGRVHLFCPPLSDFPWGCWRRGCATWFSPGKEKCECEDKPKSVCRFCCGALDFATENASAPRDPREASTHDVTRPKKLQECPAGSWLKYECTGWRILGGSSYPGDQEGTSSLFHSPSGVSVSPDGSTVFVADPGNQRCEEGLSTVRWLWQIYYQGARTTVAGESIQTNQATLSHIFHCAVCCRVRRIQVATRAASTVSNVLQAPYAIDMFPDGERLAVSDLSTRLVHIINISTGGVESQTLDPIVERETHINWCGQFPSCRPFIHHCALSSWEVGNEDQDEDEDEDEDEVDSLRTVILLIFWPTVPSRFHQQHLRTNWSYSFGWTVHEYQLLVSSWHLRLSRWDWPCSCRWRYHTGCRRTGKKRPNTQQGRMWTDHPHLEEDFFISWTGQCMTLSCYLTKYFGPAELVHHGPVWQGRLCV
jgi:hypothetical protein